MAIEHTPKKGPRISASKSRLGFVCQPTAALLGPSATSPSILTPNAICVAKGVLNTAATWLAGELPTKPTSRVTTPSSKTQHFHFPSSPSSVAGLTRRLFLLHPRAPVPHDQGRIWTATKPLPSSLSCSVRVRTSDAPSVTPTFVVQGDLCSATSRCQPLLERGSGVLEKICGGVRKSSMITVVHALHWKVEGQTSVSQLVNLMCISRLPTSSSPSTSLVAKILDFSLFLCPPLSLSL